MKTIRRRIEGIAGEVHDRLDQFLAFVVGRMGLAGKDELNRALGLFEDSLQAVEIAQQ